MPVPAGPPATRTGGLALLDLLRFGFALYVVAFHYGTGFGTRGSPTAAILFAGIPVATDPSGVTRFGWIGVELFFVLSGIVIARSAMHSSGADFLRKRALRLVPAAWLCASVTLAALAIARATPDLLPAYGHALLFWPTGVLIDPSYWTLGIEAMFYILVSAGLGRGDRTRWLDRVALLLAGASLAFWLLLANGAITVPAGTGRAFELMLLPHGAFFALGIAIDLIARQGASARRAIVVLAAAVPCVLEIRNHAGLFGLQDATAPLAIFAAGVASMTLAPRCQPWFARHVPARATVTLGLASYPLYLLHQEVGAVLVHYGMRSGLAFWPAVAVALAIVLALAFAVAMRAEPWLRAQIRALPAQIRPRRGLAPDTPRSAFPPAG